MINDINFKRLYKLGFVGTQNVSQILKDIHFIQKLPELTILEINGCPVDDFQ